MDARDWQEPAGPAEATATLALMRAGVEQASDAIVITTADLDAPGPLIVYVNPAFTRMTGYTAAEARGRSPRFLQGPKTDRAVLDRLRGACARGELFQGRTFNYRKNGGEYLLDWHIAPIRDATGTITHFIAIQQDVTALVQLEAQFAQAQKMEAIGRLAGGVAHDFNNLLLVMSTSAHFAREALPPDHPAVSDLEDVEAAASRAAALTRQLLAFSRQQPRLVVALDLNAVVEGVERMLQRVIGEDVRLVSDLARGSVPVVADASQLGQVLLNLAVNARDAMPAGGTLTMQTEVVPAAALPLGGVPASAADGAPVALLRVTDSGVGMAAEALARAFEPFYTTKDVGKGTGLGLATVYGIVEQSGGRVWIESTLGAGTCVSVTLPLATRSATPAVAARAVAASRSAGTVLLVEDDAAVRATIRRILARGGYTVLEARDARSALDQWDAHGGGIGIDVLVTDMVMPGGSGHELVGRLRATRPALPTVILSGYSPDVAFPTLLAAEGPPTAFLEKPFSAERLWEQIDAVLRAARDG